jgi:hypothetical protein
MRRATLQVELQGSNFGIVRMHVLSERIVDSLVISLLHHDQAMFSNAYPKHPSIRNHHNYYYVMQGSEPRSSAGILA